MNLQSFRGSEPLYPEQFGENKHEYMCPIWKEVLDQPVQTKCWTPHIFCASCWSLSFKMCRSLCPVCWTVTVNPNKFIEPAPFVLRTILSELDFQCPTCKHTVQLHQLPQHQEYCIQSPTTTPTHILTPSQRSVSVKPSPLVPVKPIPAAEEKGPEQVNVLSIQAELTTTTSTTTTCGEKLSVYQLLTSPKEVYSSLKEEVYSSLKEEVGLFIIRQFLSQSQDGATILLKTGGQVIKYFFKLKIKTFISKQKIR